MVCPSELILLTRGEVIEQKKQSPDSSETVRMAERSKAPDSRLDTLHCCNDIPRALWSPLGGVGSNPTRDRKLLPKATLHSNQ